MTEDGSSYPVCNYMYVSICGEHLFVSDGLIFYGRPIHPKVVPLLTISMALYMHKSKRWPWITANHFSILPVNIGLLTSDLLYVSSFPKPQEDTGSSLCQFTHSHKTSHCLIQLTGIIERSIQWTSPVKQEKENYTQ